MPGERTGWGWGWPFSLRRADFELCGFRTPFARGAAWAWRNTGAGFPHSSQTRAEESPLLVPRLPRGPGLALAEMLRGHSPEPTFTEHLLQPELGIPRPLSENPPPPRRPQGVGAEPPHLADDKTEAGRAEVKVWVPAEPGSGSGSGSGSGRFLPPVPRGRPCLCSSLGFV